MGNENKCTADALAHTLLSKDFWKGIIVWSIYCLTPQKLVQRFFQRLLVLFDIGNNIFLKSSKIRPLESCYFQDGVQDGGQYPKMDVSH